MQGDRLDLKNRLPSHRGVLERSEEGRTGQEIDQRRRSLAARSKGIHNGNQTATMMKSA